MPRTRWFFLAAVAAASAAALGLQAADNQPPEGFISLFNGTDLSGWKVPEGDNGHWKVVDGTIDCDARSEAKGDKSLWTDRSFRDCVLLIDWRLKLEPAFKNKNVPIILPDGNHLTGPDGKEVKIEIDDVDSGVYLRRKDGKSVTVPNCDVLVFDGDLVRDWQIYIDLAPVFS